MRLVEALRLTPRGTELISSPARLALVGAGGKTTALFQIAFQLPPPVIVTSTTHLASGQLGLADRAILMSSPADLIQLAGQLPEGVTLVTGSHIEEDRVSGVDFGTLEGLLSLARSNDAPLLIEADGSRQRPLKAPGIHEPALPDFVEQVVVVAGTSGLGKPLREQWVHRPELFSALSGLSLNEVITIEALARVLVSEQGGLKRVPSGARRIALLTQIDTSERQSAARRLSALLLSSYHAVISASLVPSAEVEKPPTQRELFTSAGSIPEPSVFAVRERVAGIVLAAGGSSRLGEPKQLLDWRGQPMVRHVASLALQAGLSPVILVTGAFHDSVNQAVAGLPLNIVHNPRWKTGQSTSLRAGLDALPGESGAAIFLLVDQPQAPVALLQSLVDLHSESLSPVIAPRAGGQRANPVLFDRVTFPDLLDIQGDTGGRELFSRYPVAWLDWPDESLLFDIDTVEDYRRLLENHPLS